MEDYIKDYILPIVSTIFIILAGFYIGDLKDKITDLERETKLLKDQVVGLYDYVYENNMEEE